MRFAPVDLTGGRRRRRWRSELHHGDGMSLVGGVIMSTATTVSSSVAREIGALCHAADRACGCGDLTALHDIAQELASYLPEPLHCDLLALGAACEHPREAIVLWTQLRDRVFRASEPEGEE
jgi:hypothetical protein